MSYADELAKISRTKIDLIEIIGDLCSNVYGVAPCTAALSAGSECYNTFPTCQDKPNFTKTTKTYQFINHNLPLSIINDYYGVKPYIKNIGDLPTEIKETDTIVKRLKVEFYDELDNDVGIDPYFATRASVQGTFWKKWLARNANYKGRLIKQYEGFEGMALVDFQLKFVGKIENIELSSGGVVKIEATDLLKELSKIEYPLNSGNSNTYVIGNVYTAASETEMLELPALDLDWCIRTDYGVGSFTSFTPGNGGAGALTADTYNVNFIFYDEVGNQFAQMSQVAVVTGSGDGKIDITWTDPTNTDYVEVYVRKYDSGTGTYALIDTIASGVGTTTINTIAGGTEQNPPSSAIIWWKFGGIDPTDIDSWTESHTAFGFTTNTLDGLKTVGYLQIDDEIFYYEWDGSSHYVVNVRRAQFGTDYERHDAGTTMRPLYYYPTAANPFTILQDILDEAGIDAAYIDSNFGTLETAWSDINFMTQPIVKGKLNEIYFDLVNAVDCMSWVGEDGKIKIKEHSDTSGTIPTLTDEANFIDGSVSVDLNEESRKTRWLLYWNRFKTDGSITDEENYNQLTIAIDTVAEGANEYNDEVEDILTSTWLNWDNDVDADVTTYITALLAARKDRMRDAQTIINGEVELKDNGITTGQLVDVTTSKIQDANGNGISAVSYRVIKKEPMGNKIKLKMIKVL